MGEKRKFQVSFLRENRSVTVEEGTTVLQAEIEGGLQPDAPCGGMGTCGKCKVHILNGSHPGIQKACCVKVTEDLTVDSSVREEGVAILENGESRLVPAKPMEAEGLDNRYLAAFDVGTTTVVGYLLDGESGKQIAHASMLNPQSQYGADVIMRCNYVLQNEKGKEALSHAIRTAMNQLLERLAKDASIDKKQISQVSFVGNTCMHHLFLELSPDSVVKAPYVPAMKEPVTAEAGEYGIEIHPRGRLLVLPNIGGFVGADTVGCLLATDFDHREKIALMIDIGTNGELVLGNKERMVACSTAAGPAFEGAKIHCGMRGAKGAIDHVWKENGELRYSVIGKGEAKGICGSGLMDAVALLLKEEIVESSGRFYDREELETEFARKHADRLTEVEGKPAFFLGGQVFLTQKDIREVQLAKGAMAAGITLMCRYLGIQKEEIQEVLVAGAFGNYMDPKSACAIGLIPQVLLKRVRPVGNAAGEGAKLAVINREEFQHAASIYEKVDFLELAAEKDFQDVFVDELEFPDYEEE